MTVLVTGGAGYIGSHMVLALLDAGEDVIVIDNLSAGFRWAVPDRVKFVSGDVGNLDALLRLLLTHRVDTVLHFAGSAVVPDSIADPLGYYNNNSCKSRTLIEAAVRSKVPHFIFSSSAAVYGMPERNPVAEDARPEPISPYGSSKLMTEFILRDTARAYNFRYVALRYFNVAGADPLGRSGQSTARATHLVKAACEAAVGARPHLDVYGTDYPTPDGTCIRDYIHVTDLVAAHVDALRYLRAGGESAVFNCGYGSGFSVLDVVASVKRVSKRDFPVRMGARRAGDPAAIVAKAERIGEVLRWTPKLNRLDTIVGHALAWERRLLDRGAAS